MALLEVKPSGHWSTHSPPNNEYPDAHVMHFVAKNIYYWKKERKKKKKKVLREVQVKQVDGQELQINNDESG